VFTPYIAAKIQIKPIQIKSGFEKLFSPMPPSFLVITRN